MHSNATLAAAALLLFVIAAAAQTSSPERLVIGLDLSESNPLVANPEYARKLAERVSDRIAPLPLKSEVLIRTFGSIDATANTLQVNEVISTRSRPEDVAASTELLIASVPALAAEGRLKIQSETNIVAFIRTMIDAVGECETNTTFILLTDGLEDSSYARLDFADTALPDIDIKPPNDRRYKCEELQILGLGEGLDNLDAVDDLRSKWEAWATDRNRPFKRFSGLRDW